MTDWSQVVREHGPLVWRTVYRLLNNEVDASDCFQRTFVSALELERREPVSHWPALLKHLATARALEQLRQRGRESERWKALPDGLHADCKHVGPIQAAEASELADRLRAAMAGLEPQQSEVFGLACVEGLSYEQIAERLDVTVNHVGVLLHRARSNLRGRLGADEAPAAR